MRNRYRLALLTAALAVLAGAVALSARGVADKVGTDDLSKPDPAGDVTAKGLTARERAAIDIVRVEAFGDAFATVVTVTFAGNFEGAAGRGGLSTAVAAVVLRPPRGQPTVVATHGPGEGRTAGGLGGRGPFAVLRQGRTATFVAQRFDFTKFSRIDVKTFSALGRPQRTTQGASKVSPPPPLPGIVIDPGSDAWTSGRAAIQRGECEKLRDRVEQMRDYLADSIRVLNRARAADRDDEAAAFAKIALQFEALARHFEARVAAECPPPAEDFGCEERVAKHPTAAGHSNIAVGLCKRTIDRVEMTTSPPFQRVDPQGIVVQTTANTFRIVPVTMLSDHEFAVAIQPPMESREFLQVTVQGPPSTRVEITPYGQGIRGQMSVVTTP